MRQEARGNIRDILETANTSPGTTCFRSTSTSSEVVEAVVELKQGRKICTRVVTELIRAIAFDMDLTSCQNLSTLLISEIYKRGVFGESHLREVEARTMINMIPKVALSPVAMLMAARMHRRILNGLITAEKRRTKGFKGC
jgi:hypothetical protein